MERVISTFLEFKTEENLPHVWIKSIWSDSGFSRFISFPAEFDVFLEEINITDLINDSYDALKTWFRSSGSSLEKAVANYCGDRSDIQENEFNWQTLIAEGLDFKSLICILGTLILRFQEESSNSAYFKEALIAVRLYLFCVAIPGSHICQIFNASLYSHVMSVMRIACEQLDDSLEAKKKPFKSRRNDNMETTENGSNKLDCERSELIALINDFLNHLKVIVENKKLKLDESSLNLTVQILIVVSKLEKMNATLLIYNLNNYKKDITSYIAYKGFLILLCMGKIMNTCPRESVKMILSELLPIFLVNESRTIGIGLKEGVVIRANYICFLKMLLNVIGEFAYEGVNVLIQRICLSVPDRAEMRNKAASTVIDIMRVSPPSLQAEQIYSMVFMSHMPETKTRILTLEIISNLLLDDSFICTGLSEPFAAVVNDEFLLAVIFYRCQDTSAGIKTKALSYLDQFLSTSNKNSKVKKLMDKIFIDPYLNVDNPEDVPEYKKDIFDTQQFLLNEDEYGDTSLEPLPGAKIILFMLVHFAQEDKVYIKKCSIQLLSKILMCNRLWIKKEFLEVFLIGCDDASVLVRKTMSQIITDMIVMYPDHAEIISCWVEGVCPLIAEEEIKAQEKVIEHYCKVILNNIMLYEQTTSTVSRLPWLVMKEILKQNKRSYLHFAVAKWVQNNSIKSRIIQIVYSHIDTENNDAAWCLLVSFSQFMNLPNSELIYQEYKKIRSDLEHAPHSQLVLETLYHVCRKMPSDIKENLLHQLEDDLLQCRVPLKLVARSRDICERLVSDFAPDKKKTQTAVKEWSSPKIANCLNYIESQISKDAPLECQNENKLMKYIFLLGELAQPAPKFVTKSNVKLLESILLAPKKRGNEMWKGRVTTSLKAVTILTLVKLSLQKEETASSIMPIFREILSASSVSPSIQVNAIIGMCDLCSRYTTLVERYFTCICKCFNSPHECVRKTALVSLIKRIREEYVKLRPFILFPMLTMILDKSEDIKRTVATFISNDLKKKNNILETFYTGLFYFLNNCKNHSTTVKIPDEIRTIFSYTTKPKIRQYIYIYVLDKLADPSRRLLVCKKIINDIMASVADENLKIEEKTEAIVTDAFNVLIDNEKKIFEAISKSKKSGVDDVEEIEENESKKSHGHVATSITENLRISDINEVMPILLKLKLKLKKCKSKCSKDLVLYVCEITKNYKNEMADILTADMELKAEVDYNIRKMELEQEEHKRKQDESCESRDGDNPTTPVVEINPQSMEEITEQLQSLIVELTRCDDVNIPKIDNLTDKQEIGEKVDDETSNKINEDNEHEEENEKHELSISNDGTKSKDDSEDETTDEQNSMEVDDSRK